jgi:hypothetical protein
LSKRIFCRATSGDSNLAQHRIARSQVEAADLRGRHVDVVRARQIVLVGRTQEAEAVGQRLEHALGVDAPPLRGLRLEDAEQQVLLAHARRVLDRERLRHRGELGHGAILQLGHEDALALVVEIEGVFFELVVLGQGLATSAVTVAVLAAATRASCARAGARRGGFAGVGVAHGKDSPGDVARGWGPRGLNAQRSEIRRSAIEKEWCAGARATEGTGRTMRN